MAVNKILIVSKDGEVKTPIYSYSDDIIPVMTSNTSPAPYAIIGTTEYSSEYSRYKVTDEDLTTGWMPYTSASNTFIGIDFGIGNEKNICKFTFTTFNGTYTFGVKFQGSNDRSTWIDLCIIPSNTWIAGVKNEFTFNNDKKYRYYRMLIPDKVMARIAQLEMMEKIIVGYMNIGSQTEQNFINYGMDSLAVINLKTNLIKKSYIKDQLSTLGVGKTFTQSIDLSRYKVNKISFQ